MIVNFLVAWLLAAFHFNGSILENTDETILRKDFNIVRNTVNPPESPIPNANNFARDGKVAVQEEYCLALKENTAEALELFIQRHPEESLATEAQKKLGALQDGQNAPVSDKSITNLCQ